MASFFIGCFAGLVLFHALKSNNRAVFTIGILLTIIIILIGAFAVQN